MGMKFRKCVAVDFDGVIHRYSRGWQEGRIYDPIDISGIRLLHVEGYAVAIVTSRDVRSVVDALPDDYPRTVIDYKCERTFWDGGSTGLDVLVTNRKIAAVACVDDRAIRHQFGDDWHTTVRAIRNMEQTYGQGKQAIS